MRRLGTTTAQLAKYRRQWDKMAAMAAEAQGSFGLGSTGPSRLTETATFGSNPGNLRMFSYVPEGLPANAPLVVVLHGCKQDAAGYDNGSGWSTLADRHGFAVLAPEQQMANNPNNCFNWFQAGDTARGRGEASSIRQMVEAMVVAHGTDRRRIFVTGLSAGGAMTSVMLATYPDVFAGGAIVAGLPYRCAINVQEALDCMFQGRQRPAKEWGDLVRGASSHKGPWPKVSIWHGSADTTVKPMNADEVVKQWTDVHGVTSSAQADKVDGFPHKVWRGRDGEAVVETYTITGMGHGTPLSPGGDDGVGAAGAFLLDVGISSSEHIARFFGLTEGVRQPAAEPRARDMAEPRARDLKPKVLEGEILDKEEPFAASGGSAKNKADHAASASFDVGATIANALKAAGLMKG